MPFYVVLVGDSTIDNLIWVQAENRERLARGDHTTGKCVMDHFQAFLDELTGEQNTIVSLAADGFELGHMLNGGPFDMFNKNNEHRNIKPLEELIKLHPQATHAIVSGGGNDFRNKRHAIKNPANFQQFIKETHENFNKVIDEALKARANGTQPIFMLQYPPCLLTDANHYGIYKSIKAMLPGQDPLLGLHYLMTLIFRPVLARLAKEKIPVIDMTSSLDYRNKKNFVSQIEPSDQGGSIIAKLMAHVVTHHNYQGESKIYAMPFTEKDGQIKSMPNDPLQWAPLLHVFEQNRNKFLQAYHRKLVEDKNAWCGVYSFFAKSYVNDAMSWEEIVAHAQGRGQNGSGARSAMVMRELGFFDDNNRLIVAEEPQESDERINFKAA